ncbi:MAG: hypothetical protein QMC95_17265 [Desulfitobacteriaceae bacterium]|nr:hypothetical protein [Desulfitobacteriaceae bacterium]
MKTEESCDAPSANETEGAFFVCRTLTLPDKSTSDDILLAYALDLPEKLAVADEKQTIVVFDSVQLGTNRALASLTPVFDGILDELGPAKRILTRLILKLSIYEKGTHPTEIKRRVDMLINKGIIEKTDRGAYVFVEPMLKEYLQKEY